MVLRLPVDRPEGPGVSSPAPGGVPIRGPASAAFEGGRLYLWDQANERILTYVADRLESTLTLKGTDSMMRWARSLMVTDARIYLSLHDGEGRPRVDYEIDRHDGRVLRIAYVQAGEPPLYPRERPQLPALLGKDQGASLGIDVRGHRYEWVAATSCLPYRPAGGCHEVRRLDGQGRLVGLGIKPFELDLEDVTVSTDGRVIGLRSQWEGSQINGVEVYLLMRGLGP